MTASTLRAPHEPTVVHELVSHTAVRHGDRAALSYRDDTVTYAELWHRVQQAAAAFSELASTPRTRLAVYLEKRLETVVSIFAASAASLVAVPVNPVLRARQVGYILGDCACEVLVTTPDRLASLGDVLGELPSLRVVVLVGQPGSAPANGAPAAGAPAGVQLVWWNEAVEGRSHGAAPRHTPGPIDVDVAAILYTSGSTGSPKGVVLSHRNVVAGAKSVNGYLPNGADDVILAALPLSFDAGLSQLTTGFHAGAHVVLLNYLRPADVPRACARHGVTALTCVPPLWIQIADQPWPEEARQSLRYFANTGGRMPRATLDALRRLFPDASPYLMYGLTESFRSTYLDPAEVDRRPDSIGKAIPNAEIVVVGADGHICGPGETGELVHRGALVSLGYWNDPERTAARFRPAPGTLAGQPLAELAVWSGDLVRLDEEGFLYFVGRNDEMIKTSGYRVSPTEVEEAAYATGLVKDAVAFGVDDDTLGQRIILVVSPAAGAPGDVAAALSAELRRTVPTYMLPSEVAVRDELPRSANGKFDRTAIRAEVTA
jgi:acyl-CoA ligase (AMP-forming) (exosortase A-associated)